MDFNEKSHTQIFWLKIVRNAFGVINPEDYFEFEKRVEIDHTKFIDAYVPSTGTIIEQKSPGKNLDDAFIQAKNYHDWLPLSQRGRYIITCDFNEIHVHDMEDPTKPPEIIPVESANKDNLSFLITPGELRPLEVTVSIKAGELVRKLYDSLIDSLKDYVQEENLNDDQYRKLRDDLNMFCVRLVFLLYAEDSGMFAKGQFHDYFKPRSIMPEDALEKLSLVINTPLKGRQFPIRFRPELKAFPYVDGGLFAEKVNVPFLDDESLRIIIEDMAEGFNWSGISPVIFGAIFESTLNEETRRQEGIHYTSPENIHKLIDPLFLDGLNETLATILKEPQSESRSQKLRAFQDKLAALRFLDPACGSGNFLTESFISLRKLENKLLAAIPENERPPVKVSITQFHGIEANNFAVNIARTALWISDHQMWKETRNITDSQQPPLPLKDYHHIKEGSAMDTLENLGWKLPGWNIPHEDMLYIMGNPPFLGYSQQNKGQKDDVRKFFGMAKSDYVSCWFALASQYVQDKNTKAAFLATNSLVQGEQVGYVFKQLRERWGIKIDFAHQPFVWKNELPNPKKMAHVHIVIISISTNPPEKRRLYAPDGTFRLVDNINFYLHEGPDEDIALRTDTPICANVPAMRTGNRAADGGHLIINAEDYARFIKREPRAAKYIKRYMMGREFLHNIPRYCLWLVDVSPQDIHDMPMVYKRVKACKKDRLEGAPDRQKLADTPHLFREQMNPAHYVAIPLISSEKRRYIPMGWLDDSVIPGDNLVILPDATLYDFGVLTSRVSMAWMRYVGGRMKSDYRYTVEMVYNTFVWPGYRGQGAGIRDEGKNCTLSAKHYKLITKTAQGILDARSLHPESSFAAMYNDALMPVELRRAHEKNDRAVCRAYGWDEDIGEEDIVRELFKLYHRIAERR